MKLKNIYHLSSANWNGYDYDFPTDMSKEEQGQFKRNYHDEIVMQLNETSYSPCLAYHSFKVNDLDYIIGVICRWPPTSKQVTENRGLHLCHFVHCQFSSDERIKASLHLARILLILIERAEVSFDSVGEALRVIANSKDTMNGWPELRQQLNDWRRSSWEFYDWLEALSVTIPDEESRPWNFAISHLFNRHLVVLALTCVLNRAPPKSRIAGGCLSAKNVADCAAISISGHVPGYEHLRLDERHFGIGKSEFPEKPKGIFSRFRRRPEELVSSESKQEKGQHQVRTQTDEELELVKLIKVLTSQVRLNSRYEMNVVHHRSSIHELMKIIETRLRNIKKSNR